MDADAADVNARLPCVPCICNSAAKFHARARCGVTSPLTPSSLLFPPPPMAGPDLNYAYVTVLNSVPGRGGHFGSLRIRAALNSLRGGEGVRGFS